MVRMMKVVVGSTNPVKVDAVRNVFRRIYGPETDVTCMKVESTVPAQPMAAETITGAVMRASNVFDAVKCDMAVGIEGGVFPQGVKVRGHRLYLNVQYCAIFDGDSLTIGSGGGFQTPYDAILPVLDGEEFGKVMDRITGVDDIGKKEGGIGYLTNGKLTRTQLTEQCVMSALVPRMKPELYRGYWYD
jgi:inosine/xanthosine triphosphatase